MVSSNVLMCLNVEITNTHTYIPYSSITETVLKNADTSTFS